MKSRLATIETNLAILHSALDDLVLPSDLPSTLVNICADYEPVVSVYIGSAPNEGGREQLLALCGDLFGRSDWTRVIDYGNSWFHWTKDFKGVKITLNNAEKVPLPVDKTPVAPTAFPILLSDTISSDE